MSKLRLNTLKVGQLYWVEGPARIARVVETTMIQRIIPPDPSRRMPATVEEVPAVRVLCTVPCVAVKGRKTAAQAAQLGETLRGLKGGDDAEEFDNRLWCETWAERGVQAVGSKNGVTVVLDDKFRVQLYCHEMTNEYGGKISASALVTSGILNREVELEPIADKDISLPRGFVSKDETVDPLKVALNFDTMAAKGK